MGYQIHYDGGTRNYEVRKEYPFRFPLMVAGCLLLFVFLTNLYWPEGAALLGEMIIPGDNMVTVQAFETMTEQLRAGGSIEDAVTVFCQEIIDGAQSSG